MLAATNNVRTAPS